MLRMANIYDISAKSSLIQRRLVAFKCVKAFRITNKKGNEKEFFMTVSVSVANRIDHTNTNTDPTNTNATNTSSSYPTQKSKLKVVH